MNALNLRLLPCVALLASLMASTSAHAVWTFNSSTVSNLANCTTNSSGVANSCTTSSNTNKVDTTTLSLTGFSVANVTNAASNGAATTNIVNGANKWSTAALNSYSGGQGVNGDGNGTEPNHATDNNGRTESILLSFSSSIALSSLGAGYTASSYCARTTAASSLPATVFPSSTDTCPTGYAKRTTQTDGTNGVDVSLFRWVGDGAPTGTSALTNTTAGTMTGWQLVGNYGDIVADTSNPYNLVNSTGLTSSYWLVSAYNSGFAPTAGVTESRGALTNGDDYFKLFAAAGTTCTTNLVNGKCGGSNSSVPEPASLALTSVALLGVAGIRRRRNKPAA